MNQETNPAGERARGLEAALLADLKHALRQLRQSPGFTLTAISTLALGIGATTAIFTLVHAVLLRSLPVKDPAQLLRVGDNEQCCFNGGLPDFQDPVNDWSLFSYLQYEQFRDHTAGFASLAAFESTDDEMAVRRTNSGNAAQAWYGEFVSGNSFDTLGLRPYAGRLLQPSDDVKGAAPVAVISFQMWEQELGSDPSIVGSSFTVNGQPVTIVGIAPPGFYSERLSPTPPALWLPIDLIALVQPIDADLLVRGGLQWLNLIGRMTPGANPAAIQAQMQVELLQFLESPEAELVGPERTMIPKQYLRLSAGGGGVQRMQDQYKDDLQLLMWIASFVLLIACANLANLMLARSMARRQQAAVRTALGASRSRLVQRALVECVVLAIVGGLAGTMVAWGGARLIVHLAFQHDSSAISASPSAVVLGFAFGVSLLTGLLFGVAPAWFAAHADPIEALRGANRSTGRHTTLAQKGLVVAQAAVSVVLLCAAGFLILSLQKLEHQHFGFDTANRTMVEFNAQTVGLKPDRLDVFYRRLNESVSSIPGVSHVAWSLLEPDGRQQPQRNCLYRGPACAASRLEHEPGFMGSGEPGLFHDHRNEAAGGALTLPKTTTATRPTWPSWMRAFVKKYLHGENPIGAHFGDWDSVVHGHVHHSRRGGRRAVLAAGRSAGAGPSDVLPARVAVDAVAGFSPERHRCMRSSSPRRTTWVRWKSKPKATCRIWKGGCAARSSRLNPNLMIIALRSFGQQVELGFSQQQMIVQLTSLFGLIALVLAAIGIYGVTAYAVAQRTSEIGIRMALGANRADVRQMVLRGAFLQGGPGAADRIPAAIAAGHLMAAELFGVRVWNPLVLGTTTAVLGAVALVAAVLPAQRAASVDPMEALRGE